MPDASGWDFPAPLRCASCAAMSSDTPSNPPTNEPAPAAPAAPAAEAPKPRRPRIIRRSFVILLLLLVVITIASVPFVIEPWVVSTIRSSVKDAGMELAPETEIRFSLVGGKLSATKLEIRETYQGETRTVFAADEVDADLAVMDSLGGDVVIERLVATGCRGDLRRRGDGTVPVIPPPEDGEGIDWSKIDWWDYYRKAVDRWKQRKEEEKRQQEEEARKPPEQRQPPPPPDGKPATEERWKDARVYTPPPAPGGRGPRVLIRELKVSGTSLGLPDQTAFDVTGFEIAGTDVTGVQLPEETMTLTAKLKTTGAGTIDLDLVRKPGEDGTLRLSAKGLPLAALDDPKIAGGVLKQYGATGIADLVIDTQWKGWDLTGLIDSTLNQFDLNPQQPSTELQQVALAVKQLKGQPIRWPIGLGGSIVAPTITDSGLDEVLKGSMADAAKAAAKQRATEEANKAIDKELQKNPELQKAKEQAGGLLKGLGGGR